MRLAAGGAPVAVNQSTKVRTSLHVYEYEYLTKSVTLKYPTIYFLFDGGN
jgi:hypothetical protein